MEQRFHTTQLARKTRPTWLPHRIDADRLMFRRSATPSIVLFFFSFVMIVLAAFSVLEGVSLEIRLGLPRFFHIAVGIGLAGLGIWFAIFARARLRERTLFDRRKKMIDFHRQMVAEPNTSFAAFKAVRFAEEEKYRLRTWEIGLVRKDGVVLVIDRHSDFPTAISQARLSAEMLDVPLVDPEGRKIDPDAVVAGTDEIDPDEEALDLGPTRKKANSEE